jgi:hypothetical protein
MWDGKINIGWMRIKNDLNMRGWELNDKHLAYTRDADKDIVANIICIQNVWQCLKQSELLV